MNWHFLVLQRESSTLRLFIDDIVTPVGSNTAVTDLIKTAPGGLVVGQEQDSLSGTYSANQSLAGKIDNLFIYNRALNSTEISQLKNYPRNN